MPRMPASLIPEDVSLAPEPYRRVHTSTATVAVMPEVDDVQVKIDPKDIEMHTARSGGAGKSAPYVPCSWESRPASTPSNRGSYQC